MFKRGGGARPVRLWIAGSFLLTLFGFGFWRTIGVGEFGLDAFGLLLLLIGSFFVALYLGVFCAEAGDFVLDGHHGVTEKHFFLPALHDRKEVAREAFAETGRLALFANRFAYAVGTAADFYQNGREHRRAFGAKFAVGRAVIGVAIFAKRYADIFFFFRDVVLQFGFLALGQDAFDFVENSHDQTPFAWGLVNFNCRAE